PCRGDAMRRPVPAQVINLLDWKSTGQPPGSLKPATLSWLSTTWRLYVPFQFQATACVYSPSVGTCRPAGLCHPVRVRPRGAWAVGAYKWAYAIQRLLPVKLVAPHMRPGPRCSRQTWFHPGFRLRTDII